MTDLFGNQPPDASTDSGHATRHAPLAERVRPRTLADVVGQESALGPNTVLGRAIASKRLPSLILWGPPGCGKTTLAAVLARSINTPLLAYSAVRVGVKELKAAMSEAARMQGERPPVLFLDEIHRFNKAQQDALLPHVEAGDVTLVGATTENPSFEVNAALLSRCRLIVLEPLDQAALVRVLERAIERTRDDDTGPVDAEALEVLAQRSGGDARFALGSLELALSAAQREDGRRLTSELAHQVVAEAHLVYDKAGEEHFNLASALHKSLRNSDAQAGIYWLARTLEAGEDPAYVARRLVRFASEDVGLADPQALVQCMAAAQAVHRLGMPEGALALAQAATYCAQAPKSNALYRAYNAAKQAIADGARDPVPLHLRNAPTKLMKNVGYGDGYQYAHDDDTGVSAMECLPPSMHGRVLYRPGDRGFEQEAGQRLRHAWKLAHRQPAASDEQDA